MDDGNRRPHLVIVLGSARSVRLGGVVKGRFSSNVNGTTVCVSHVSGITGARHVIEGNIEYGYSWLICGWTSNSGLNLTVACWAMAVEANMS